MRMLFWSVVIILFFATTIQAQDYDIQRFDINAQLQPSNNSVQVQAKLTVVNITTQGRSGPFITFKLNKRAKVTGMQIDGTTVEVRQKNDERLTELANVSADFPKALAPAATANITINYTLEIKESSPINAIIPGSTILLPESFWVPFIHTPFAITYGIDVAPVNLQVTSVENERPQADGQRQSSNNTFTFQQNLPAQPILLSGNYDDPIEIAKNNIKVEFVYPRGISSNARKQAESLTTEMSEVVDFYNQFLGINLPKQFRVISSDQIGSYVTGTTFILGEDFFRRDSLDIETIEFVARALLKTKIGGESVPRGKGWTILQDALPVYLSAFYFEKRYGTVGEQEFFARRIRAYAPVAANKSDGALLSLSTLDSSYTTSILNKAPLMLRIIEQQLGRDKMLALIKDLIKERQIKFDDLRKNILNANKDLTKELELFFDQWFDKIVDPDFIIGVPLAKEDGWVCALRNLGNGNVTVKVLAITEKGAKLFQTVNLASLGRGEVFFKTLDKIVKVEVDPDKLYPQTNYDNDSRPPITSAITLFRDANIAFNKKSYVEAEAKLKEALELEPNNIITRTLLARSFLATNKFSEAKTEVDKILATSTPLPNYSVTWVNYLLAELALSQKNTKDSIDYFRRAITVSKDNSFIRNKLIDLEASASQLPATEESIRSFMGQLDKAIKDSSSQALETVLVRANLNKFVRGLVGNKPDSWTTEIVRTETISNDKVAVDVIVTAVDINKREQSGEALYILRRKGTGWILNNVEFFNIE